MNGQAGKGSGPRQGQYSKKAQALWSAGYDRAFGVSCSVCNGTGYHWDDNGRGKVVKTACLVCNGTGKVRP